MKPILGLKGASSRTVLERTKFLTLTVIVENRRPTEYEVVELTYLLDRLFDEADISFVQRYSKLIREISATIFLIKNKVLPAEVNSQIARNYLRQVDSELKIHNAYFGRKEQNPPKSLLRLRTAQSMKRPIRKRFIGVGYKDHGTMKNIATDGTPSWKEVSSFNSTEEKYWEGIDRIWYLELTYERFPRVADKLFKKD
jgi:hypothetical protein